MTTMEFELLDAINREGLENTEWGLYKFSYETDTSIWFGTEVPMPLEEDVPYLALWLGGCASNRMRNLAEQYHCEIYEEMDGNTDFYIFKLQ